MKRCSNCGELVHCNEAHICTKTGAYVEPGDASLLDCGIGDDDFDTTSDTIGLFEGFEEDHWLEVHKAGALS